ncbi:MAG TPA: EAL domain-containing protein [Gallionella sp.]|nr:EAL domain-containing protein [Gallionella sp.]
MNTPPHDFHRVCSRTHVGNTGHVTAQFRDFSIASAFQPIFSLSHRSPVGYEALCRASAADGSPVSPLALFGQVKDESDNVLLDRLCRAVHVQNFSVFSDKSWIFLNVDPLVTVLGKSYGSFFKEMLEHSQIPPGQVVIEILEKSIYDESILSAAVNYYKNLGCLVAIDDFGASHSNFDRIWNIQPDIVKFDRSIVVQAESNRAVRKALPNMVSLIQELGCITLMEGVETEQQALIAMDSNVDLVQGYYFGYPREQLVDAHEQDNTLAQLCDKHVEFSAAARNRHKERMDRPMAEFNALLRQLKSGATDAVPLCGRLLALPDVMRMYFLDEAGYQIGENIVHESKPKYEDPRYRPLAEATEANWSRRYYFREAMLNPGEIQVTRPYRSLIGKNPCVTLSALIDRPSGRFVACVDLDWP